MCRTVTVHTFLNSNTNVIVFDNNVISLAVILQKFQWHFFTDINVAFYRT